MTTPRIEEMVDEFENIFVYDYELSEGFERPVGSEPSFRKEVKAEHMGDVLRLVREGKDWLRQALTEAHQAGIDEAVEKVDYWIKHRGTCAVEFEARDCDCGLADTIKALRKMLERN